MEKSWPARVTSALRIHPVDPLGRTGTITFSQPVRAPITRKTCSEPDARGLGSVQETGVASSGAPKTSIDSPFTVATRFRWGEAVVAVGNAGGRGRVVAGASVGAVGSRARGGREWVGGRRRHLDGVATGGPRAECGEDERRRQQPETQAPPTHVRMLPAPPGPTGRGPALVGDPGRR